MNAIFKPHVVLRVESDDYALLYDPDTGESFVLDPVSLFVCQRLDGNHSIEAILEESRSFFDGIPEEASKQITEFIALLVANKLATN